MALGKAIGDETRFQVLRPLRDGPRTGTELADRLGIPRTSLHYHLSLLRAAGLVEIALDDARYGRLRLRDEALDDLGRLLVEFVLDEHGSSRARVPPPPTADGPAAIRNEPFEGAPEMAVADLFRKTITCRFSASAAAAQRLIWS